MIFVLTIRSKGSPIYFAPLISSSETLGVKHEVAMTGGTREKGPTVDPHPL